MTEIKKRSQRREVRDQKSEISPTPDFRCPTASADLPLLHWANRQRFLRLDLERLRTLVAAALPLCLAKPRFAGVTLPPEIEITLLGEAAIARVHREFLEDPTPTDVITFEHGEILIGVPIAAANAAKFGHPELHEVALCVIHGLLHLLAYDDLAEEERRIMHARQEEILTIALHDVPVS